MNNDLDVKNSLQNKKSTEPDFYPLASAAMRRVGFASSIIDSGKQLINKQNKERS